MPAPALEVCASSSRVSTLSRLLCKAAPAGAERATCYTATAGVSCCWRRSRRRLLRCGRHKQLLVQQSRCQCWPEWGPGKSSFVEQQHAGGGCAGRYEVYLECSAAYNQRHRRRRRHPLLLLPRLAISAAELWCDWQRHSHPNKWIWFQCVCAVCLCAFRDRGR